MVSQKHFHIYNKFKAAKFNALYLCLKNCVFDYRGCNRRNGPDFGRVFLMLNYTEKPQNTYIQSSMVTEI